MREIVLLIPDLPGQNIEIDVHIGGKKSGLKYRVELLDWEGQQLPPKDKVAVLKHKIDAYDKNWELVEIGQPDEQSVPLMFRKKLD